MKPAAAFALGLWTGAVLTAAVGTFYFRLLKPLHIESSSQDQSRLETRVQVLQQEQSRAAAEQQRWRQQVADLKNTIARLQTEVQSQPRAVEVRETPAPTAGNWIEAAVIAGDTQALPRLEQAALQGDEAALDAVALLADRDRGAGLLHVWSAATVPATKTRVVFLVAATLEVIPQAGELLLALFTSAPNELNLLEAALTGLANPDFATDVAPRGSEMAPPHFQLNVTQRLKLLENLRATLTDDRLLTIASRVQSNLIWRISEREMSE
jgi:hypothetical protein